MKKLYFVIFAFTFGCFLANGWLENDKRKEKEATVSKHLTVELPYFDQRFEHSECYAQIENGADRITPSCEAGTKSARKLEEKEVKSIYLSKTKLTGVTEDYEAYQNEGMLYFNLR